MKCPYCGRTLTKMDLITRIVLKCEYCGFKKWIKKPDLNPRNDKDDEKQTFHQFGLDVFLKE